MQGDHEENRRLSERMTAAARQLGDPIRLAMALNNLGISAQDYGDYETAAVMFSEADSLAAQARSPRIRMIMKNSVGMVSRLQGQHQRARHVLDDVITVARQTGDDMMLCGALDSIAPSLIALGEIELADRYWRESTSIARVISDHVVLLADLVGLAQVASIRQDDCRALRLAAGARAASARWSLSFVLDINSRCDATVAASRSRLGQAAAERCWNEGSALTDVALVQYALDHEARALDDSGPLTRRELEVVRLVAAGKTNRQIAAALFLSERGAEGHVERIRNKLGFHSRAEIAAWAVARGLVDTREKEKGTLAGPPTRTRKHRTL
jgi:non-specific serine/threonine protein kinase